LILYLRRDKMSVKLTRFEKARILGARSIQISMGAKPKVKIGDSIDPIDIAMLELEEGVLPIDVKKIN
jgi:DNA-directed RNA polymerase subunit K